MGSSIEPIAPRHRRSLVEHLGRFGLPPEIVDWKYYGRSRGADPTGLAWVRDGRVQGTVGLIPFSVQVSGTKLPAAWTCDWLVESPEANPGIGIVLLRKARELIDPLFTVGGNDVTRRLVTRMAAATVEDAAEEWHLALRVGGLAWFDGLERRMPALARAARRFPLVRVGRSPGVVAPDVRIEAGVSAAVGPALELRPDGSPRPAYDLGYLRWQLDACPALRCVSIYVPARQPAAAAVCWSLREAGLRWRMALWSRDPEAEETASVLGAAVAHVRARGAVQLATITRRENAAMKTLLRRWGFAPAPRARTLFVLTGRADVEALTPLALSFLDGDLAYRF